MRRAALVVVVLASALLVFGTARTAHACSCATPDDASAFAAADAVFVGRLVDTKVADGDSWTSTDPKRWIFAVEGVYRGEVFARQSIVSARDGASCGLELSGPGPFLVFARAKGDGLTSGAVPGEYYANLCGGSRSVADAATALSASIATPSPPKAGASPTGTLPSSTSFASRTWIGVIVAAVALGSVGGAVVLVRRSNRTTAA